MMKMIIKNSIKTTFLVSLALTFVGPIAVFAAGPGAINLGTAGRFAVLAKTGISTTGVTSITGNIGVSPAPASYITGFGLTMDSSNEFSTSPIVTGDIYAADYTAPTPAVMTSAILDMQNAYTDGAGRTNPTATELGAGNIGGMTLAPGLYTWSTGVTIPTNLTLSGGANDVWIFQIAQNLNISAATNVILSGGAQASNIFWIVGGQTTIGTTAVFSGNILDQTAIVLQTGAQLNGRALAQSAVTLDANDVIVPTSVIPMTITVSPTPTPAPSTVANTTLVQTQAQTETTGVAPTTNSAAQAELNSLVTTLHSLQTEAAQSSNLGIQSITANLAQGMSNTSVATLQQFLISQNKGPAAEALARAGTTSYFGALTRAALGEFQANVGVSPALGNFGAITRAYLAAHY
jgi:hypothetical protein